MAEKYRKKPVVIEAMRYTGTPDTCVAIHEWCGYQHNPEAGCDSGIYIDTLEGQMRADVGDWIIKGVQGEFYPCKPDIFEETHELVDEDAKWAAVSRLQAAVVAATPRGGLAMRDFEQGEPTDAEVEAATVAAYRSGASRYVNMYTLGQWMRAALRAAFATRGTDDE